MHGTWKDCKHETFQLSISQGMPEVLQSGYLMDQALCRLKLGAASLWRNSRVGSALSIPLSYELCASLVNGYVHSRTKLCDFASDSPAAFGHVINLSGPQFTNLICEMGIQMHQSQRVSIQ